MGNDREPFDLSPTPIRPQRHPADRCSPYRFWDLLCGPLLIACIEGAESYSCSYSFSSIWPLLVKAVAKGEHTGPKVATVAFALIPGIEDEHEHEHDRETREAPSSNGIANNGNPFDP